MLKIISGNTVPFELLLKLSTAYWVAVSWIYPVYAAAAFFLFGKLSGKASVHS